MLFSWLLFFPLLMLLSLALLAFWIWMLVDCAKRINSRDKDLTIWIVWLVVIIVFNVIGTTVYYFAVYAHQPRIQSAAPLPPPPGALANPSPPAVRCPKCGAAMPADAPEGLCPRCLVQMNLTATAQATRTQMPASDGAEPLPSPETIAPNFPQLEILECLGRGGMGVVYKARQPRLDRVVALKILAPGREKDPQFAERFMREARALAKLNHQNIVTVYDFGESGGLFFLLMEYVDGVTLRGLLQGGKLDSAQALNIVPRICEALQYAHEQGVVHRDIKPENVLVDKQGRVKIADFGIARIVGSETGLAGYTKGQAVVGTPYYMAPEQVEKPLSVDHRADIYSLGVVFYEMLTGELPMGRFALPSEKVRVDVRLDEVVLRALEKEPQRRYQQASHVKTDVETISGGGAPDRASPPPARPRSAVPPSVTAPDLPAALRQMNVPARALQILGLVQAIAGFVCLVLSLETDEPMDALRPAMFTAAVALLFLGISIMWGGRKLRRLASFGGALIMAGSSVFFGVVLLMATPLLVQQHNPMALLLPVALFSALVGFWVLSVLLRPEVRAAFAEVKATGGVPEVAPEWGVGKSIVFVLGCIALFVFVSIVIYVGMGNSRGRSRFGLKTPWIGTTTSPGVFVVGPPLPPAYGPPSVEATSTEAANNAAQREIEAARQRALETQLAQAQSDLARLQQLADNGLAPMAQLNALKEEVDVLRAEQTGDAVKVAEVRLQWAQKKFADLETSYRAGLVPDSDYEKARAIADLAAAEVQNAIAEKTRTDEATKARAAASAQTAPSPAVPASANHVREELQTRLSAIRMISSLNSREAALRTFARDAAESDDATMVISAVNAISTLQNRDTAAREAARTLARRGHLTEAIQVARLITSLNTRDATLSELSK